MRLAWLGLLFAACASSAPPMAADDADDASSEVRAILGELNEWCAAQGDECDVSERPRAYPGRVAHGETNGWIAAQRERLRALGAEVEWSPADRRFVLRR